MITELIRDSVEFGEFLDKHEKSIMEVALLLSKPFEEEIHCLEQQISLMCSKLEFVSRCYTYSEMFLTNARYKSRPGKGHGVTEMDRNMYVAEHTRYEQLFRDWTKRLIEDISTYLDKAQSVLSCHRVELEKFGYGKRV